MSELTLAFLRSNEKFDELYLKVLLNQELSVKEEVLLLRTAALMMKADRKELKTYGYRIILLFAIHRKELTPLYDISLKLGYYPVVKLLERIDESLKKEDRFFSLFQNSFIDEFQSDKKYLTEQQLEIQTSYNEIRDTGGLAFIAPTSYGKSELIVDVVLNGEKSCVIVPTKALISQTKKNILNKLPANQFHRIITHHEMYNGEDEFVAVLTQERLVRFLIDNPNLQFDEVCVDEAHNLLAKESRSEILAMSLMILKNRNPDTQINFFTPFLDSFKYLSPKNTKLELKEFRIQEYLKSERLFLYDKPNNKLSLYDQFLNKKIDIQSSLVLSEEDFVMNYGTSKTAVYLNRPKDALAFAIELATKLDDVDSANLDKAIKDISDYTNEAFSLLYCLKKGVMFHHGSLPDNIKTYLEFLYSELDEIKYLVTTSTLLEGVNIPANSLFILSNLRGQTRLSRSQFQNLTGRVCRFKEIFNESNKDISLLSPSIYVMKSRFMKENASLDILVDVAAKVDKKAEELPENILLEETNNIDPDKLKITLSELSCLDESIQLNENEFKQPETNIGKICFQNHVKEFDIFLHEKKIEDKISQFEDDYLISTPEELLVVIDELFLSNIEEGKFRNIARLRSDDAKKFYNFMLNRETLKLDFKSLVDFFISYWKKHRDKKNQVNETPFAYVGKWGDRTKPGEGHIKYKYWIDLNDVDDVQIANLAIVRVKEERDFIDFYLFRFVEILNTIGMIEQSYYHFLKYGTDNEDRIELGRIGMSLTLIDLLHQNYENDFSVSGHDITFSSELKGKMIDNEENSLLVHELTMNLPR